MKIYQNKKKPWKSVFTLMYHYEKPFFFHVRKTPKRQKPSYHAMINLFLVSFWRDNSNFRIGLGFGKNHYSLNIHS